MTTAASPSRPLQRPVAAAAAAAAAARAAGKARGQRHRRIGRRRPPRGAAKLWRQHVQQVLAAAAPAVDAAAAAPQHPPTPDVPAAAAAAAGSLVEEVAARPPVVQHLAEVACDSCRRTTNASSLALLAEDGLPSSPCDPTARVQHRIAELRQQVLARAAGRRAAGRCSQSWLRRGPRGQRLLRHLPRRSRANRRRRGSSSSSPGGRRGSALVARAVALLLLLLLLLLPIHQALRARSKRLPLPPSATPCSPPYPTRSCSGRSTRSTSCRIPSL